MGHGCIPNLSEKLDCSSSGSSGSPGNGSVHNCGCDPEDVAFKNIVGYGKATCTKPGKKSGKKSVWTLTCGKSLTVRLRETSKFSSFKKNTAREYLLFIRISPMNHFCCID